MFGKREKSTREQNIQMPLFHNLHLDPLVCVVKSEGGPIKLILDSRIRGDLGRALVVDSLQESNPVFTLSDITIPNQLSDSVVSLSLDVQNGAGGGKRNLLKLLLPNALFAGLDTNARQNFVENVREVFLTRIAQGLALPLQAHPSEDAPKITLGAAKNPIESQRKFWKKALVWLAFPAAIILLIFGLSGLMGKKEVDPFAGIDPQLRQQMEAAGLRGAANPAAANVTEQTLKAMGLDPGKAATNSGCIAGQ